jgi:outer membrane lipoprotein carrier protein
MAIGKYWYRKREQSKKESKMFKLVSKILLIIFPCIVFASSPSQELIELLSSFNSLQANFVQSVVNDKSRISQQLNGQVSLQRPNLFRWEIKQPNRQLIIADGANIWVYDADLQQATKQKIDYRQSNNPAVLLSGSLKDLPENFIVTKLSKSDIGKWFELKPKTSNTMFQKIQLQFRNGKLSTMYITDNLGQLTKLVFTNVRINLKLKPILFKFNPSPNIDIVEN